MIDVSDIFYPTLTLPDILGREPDFLISPLYKGGLRGVIIRLKSQHTTFQTTSKTRWNVTTFFFSISFAIFGFSLQTKNPPVPPIISHGVACSNQSPNNADSGYGSAPSTTTSPTSASSVSESPTASATTTLAQSHWSAIAQGDLTKVMSQYAESPTLQWVGGPLAGKYQGKDKIQVVWQKFIKAQAPLETPITNVKSTTPEQRAEEDH